MSLVLVTTCTLVAAGLLANPEAIASPDNDRDIIHHDFTAANERALAGDLPAAIALYESIIERGLINEDVFFNLGNAYAGSGRRVDAIIAYERARSLSPGSEDIEGNLEAVRRQLLREAGFNPPPDETGAELADTLAPLVTRLPEMPFAIIALVANAIAFLTLFIRRRAIHQVVRHRATVLLAVAAIVLAAALLVIGAHAVVHADRRGVIVAKEPLRDGPHPRFKARGEAIPGLRVRIVSTDGGWQEVQAPDGTTGWISSKGIVEIANPDNS